MHISNDDFQSMANGVNGVNILFALRHVELEVKQELEPVIILSHQEEEKNARDHHQNQETVAFEHVQVRKLLVSL